MGHASKGNSQEFIPPTGHALGDFSAVALYRGKTGYRNSNQVLATMRFEHELPPYSGKTGFKNADDLLKSIKSSREEQRSQTLLGFVSCQYF